MARIYDEVPRGYEPPTFKTVGSGLLACSHCGSAVGDRQLHEDWHADRAVKSTLVSVLIAQALIPKKLWTKEIKADAAWALRQVS